MSQKTKILNVCIVGNIGSGKSTLTRLLEKSFSDSVAIPEVFHQNPFLKLYVQDPPRWAFENAVRYFYDYARVYHELTAARHYTYAFIDAGGATNRYIYGRYLLASQVMTPAEDRFYNVLCDMIQHRFDYPEPDAYIFLDLSPAACYARMTQRGWKYQTRHIPLDYLTTLQRYFRSLRRRVEKKGIPTLVLERQALDFKTKKGREQTLALVRPFLESQLPAL